MGDFVEEYCDCCGGADGWGGIKGGAEGEAVGYIVCEVGAEGM
jgi:hypothetical protein